MPPSTNTISQAGSDISDGWPFSPSPGTFYVIRINAEEMVRHLNDDLALEAARRMEAKSYLVYLDNEMDLPFPDKPWYRFKVTPIAPHLRPANIARGYTSDMCIPIYPNTNHPTDRAPIHPETPFPYGNCYHWLDNTIHIRVRAQPEGFDESKAVLISTDTEVMMHFTFARDLACARHNVELAQQQCPGAAARTDAEQPAPVSQATVPSMLQPTIAVSNHSLASHSAGQDQADVADTASVNSAWSGSSKSARAPNSSIEDIMRMDIFTGPDEDLDLVPLVNIWADLAEHLKEEDIPSPLELYKEIATIKGIVQQARIRAYAAQTAHIPQPDASQNVARATAGFMSTHGRVARLLSMCGRLQAPAKRLMSRAKHAARLPYILVWP